VSVPVLTAVTDPGLEARLATAFGHPAMGVTVARRCVDLADLLAAAATGKARAVLVSGDLRRLDREALARLVAAGVVPVGLAGAGDEQAEQRLRQLGVASVVTTETAPAAIAAALVEAAGRSTSAGSTVGASARGWADPLAALPILDDAPHHVDTSGGYGPSGGDGTGQGRVVAVWGPTGAPGRSSVALHVAAEAALLGARVLLVDADPYGGSISTLVGAVDEPPGLSAACRTANAGVLDLVRLSALCRTVRLDAPAARGAGQAGQLLVLTGPPTAARWSEQRASSVEAVLEISRGLAELVVVDTGFSLETDEELAYDSLAPRRNGATLAALDAADTVLAVGSADPLGLQRLIRGLGELSEAVPEGTVDVVVNRLRPGVVPGGSREQVEAALLRHGGRAPLAYVPDDRAAFDAAVLSGRTLAEVSPGSPARAALLGLAATLCGRPAPARRHRSWRGGRSSTPRGAARRARSARG